jgi:hypothetical protein
MLLKSSDGVLKLHQDPKSRNVEKEAACKKRNT